MLFRSIRSPTRPTLVVGLAVLTGLGATAGPLGIRPARAGEAEVQQAREHFKRGDQAFKAERFEEAYREWESGYKLSGRPLFLLNMAHAERRRGELAGARALYKKYLLMEPTSKLRGEVEQVLTEIDSALEVNPAAGAAPVAPSSAAGGPGPGATQPPAFTGPVPMPTPERAADAPNLLGPPPADQQLQATADRPFYRRWWFWAGVGTLVAGGALTAVLLRRGDDYTKSGSLGTIGMAR